MAISGFALFLFVIAHMLGNLQVFLGAEQINRYGHFLQSTPELLWPARIGLLVLVLVHIFAAIKLSQENKAARPVAYHNYQMVAASYASRTMLMSGLIVLAFIIYHLLHYTAQVQYVNFTGQNFVDFTDPQKRHDVYKMMVVGFSKPLVSLFYIVGVGLLCLHLSHGVSSMFQSLGWKNKYYGQFLDKFARIISWVIFLGYVSIPVSVLAGFLKEAVKP
ncbi:MAG: succinate dehydrogenase (or fumarate reductase) cytochrome b subunit, b558 family [Verrucomicrobiales bacterium]|nr:succinate dehydrogenase (or fumarate reductase) cytochrome b subunit, b558 family [Verrucomicrobiales bacterium]